MKIGLKLILIISAVNLVGIGGLTIAATVSASNGIRNIAETNARRVTAVTAGMVKAYVEVPMDEIRTVGFFLEMFFDNESLIPVNQRRDMANFYLETLTIRNPSFVGVWAAFEPNALDGRDAEFVNTPGSDSTGRFVSYWTNNNGRIDLSPLLHYTTADYYTIPLRTGLEYVTEPYYENIGGQQVLVMSVTVPIMRAGRAIGVAGVDLELTNIEAMVAEIRPFQTGIAGVYSPLGMVVTSSNAQKIGRPLREVSADMYTGQYMDMLHRALSDGTEFFETFYSREHGAKIMVITSPFFLGGDPDPWSAVTIVEEATVMAAVTHMTYLLIALGVGILVAITIVIFFVARSITAPLKSMENVFTFIGDGDFTHSIAAKGNDEIGNIGRALNSTVDKIKKLINSVKVEATELSSLGSDLASNMNETAAAINEITSNIQSIKGRTINQSASVTETNATMEQITGNISKLNEQVDRQTTSVSQSSSAIEEMLANVQSVTQTLVKNSENVNSLESASEVGRTGLQAVSQDIQEITRESEGLLEINSVMENIASQTNLLSMNAAIEAAHAGEAGKGFAVVAAEIRKLAENSSAQSKTISTVLKKIKGSIDKITISTDNVLQKFEVIDKHIKTVADQEENIRNAMEEQGQGSKQILEAIGKLNDITQHVKSEADEMRNGSKEVIQEGRNLEIITQEITGGMNEMSTGADQINVAIHRVNDLTASNREKIGHLMKEVGRFKVE